LRSASGNGRLLAHSRWTISKYIDALSRLR
jgi:hypothetical protein